MHTVCAAARCSRHHGSAAGQVHHGHGPVGLEVGVVEVRDVRASPVGADDHGPGVCTRQAVRDMYVVRDGTGPSGLTTRSRSPVETGIDPATSWVAVLMMLTPTLLVT